MCVEGGIFPSRCLTMLTGLHSSKEEICSAVSFGLRRIFFSPIQNNTEGEIALGIPAISLGIKTTKGNHL